LTGIDDSVILDITDNGIDSVQYIHALTEQHVYDVPFIYIPDEEHPRCLAFATRSGLSYLIYADGPPPAGQRRQPRFRTPLRTELRDDGSVCLTWTASGYDLAYSDRAEAPASEWQVISASPPYCIQ